MDRRQALKQYLLEVVRDLATRGVIRYQSGQSWTEILHHDLPTIVGEVRQDLMSVGLEIGVGLAGGVETIVRKKVDAITDSVVAAIAHKIKTTVSRG